jgi:hypothetical protein
MSILTSISKERQVRKPTARGFFTTCALMSVSGAINTLSMEIRRQVLAGADRGSKT